MAFGSNHVNNRSFQKYQWWIFSATVGILKCFLMTRMKNHQVSCMHKGVHQLIVKGFQVTVKRVFDKGKNSHVHSPHCCSTSTLVVDSSHLQKTEGNRTINLYEDIFLAFKRLRSLSIKFSYLPRSLCWMANFWNDVWIECQRFYETSFVLQCNSIINRLYKGSLWYAFMVSLNSAPIFCLFLI